MWRFIVCKFGRSSKSQFLKIWTKVNYESTTRNSLLCKTQLVEFSLIYLLHPNISMFSSKSSSLQPHWNFVSMLRFSSSMPSLKSRIQFRFSPIFLFYPFILSQFLYITDTQLKGMTVHWNKLHSLKWRCPASLFCTTVFSHYPFYELASSIFSAYRTLTVRKLRTYGKSSSLLYLSCRVLVKKMHAFVDVSG